MGTLAVYLLEHHQHVHIRFSVCVSHFRELFVRLPEEQRAVRYQPGGGSALQASVGDVRSQRDWLYFQGAVSPAAWSKFDGPC